MSKGNIPIGDDVFIKMVKEMRISKAEGKKKKCQQEKRLLEKCILCKYYLSSQQWGPLLERFIKDKFSIRRAANITSGDGLSPNGFNIEIKVSLGNNVGKLNFVQIRPDHNINFYLFLVYNIFEGEKGSIHWLLCPSIQLYELLYTYGSYAHGTVSKLGKINHENIFGRSCEYALRPNLKGKESSKGKILWNIMCEKFNVTEEEIKSRI